MKLGDCKTLAEILSRRAQLSPDAHGFTFLVDGETEGARYTYAELDRRARAIAAELVASGSPGDRVLLLFQHGLPYVAAFFGCLYAGRVPVPAYPPEPGRLQRTVPRLSAIAADAGAAIVATTKVVRAMMEQAFELAPEIARLRWVVTDELDDASRFTAPLANDALTLLQYTSGSTGTPKGVMVTHENLLYSFSDFEATCGFDDKSVGVSWLPQFHDMGLVYGILQPVYSGFPCYLMEPMAFLLQPARWLRAISRYRGTHNAAPNFAYELCVKKMDEQQRAELDLSSWRVAINAAEPIRADTIDRFVQAFEGAGFRRSTFKGGYGLAEATLKVTLGSLEQVPTVATLDAAELEQNRVVAGSAARPTRVLIGCGAPYIGTTLAIVDPETRAACPVGHVGEIWVRGPCVASGYWNRAEETEALFHARIGGSNDGPYLRTGDLGFLRDGEVYITGRWKDLIILRGRNLYPSDLELSSEKSHPALRPGCGAAFSVDVAGEERLVIAHERDPKKPGEPDEVIWAIRAAIAEDHEVHAQAVVLIAPGSLPKTSSGKIRRRECRRQYLAEELNAQRIWTARS